LPTVKTAMFSDILQQGQLLPRGASIPMSIPGSVSPVQGLHGRSVFPTKVTDMVF
jgi:hypothetical protein